MSIDITNWVKRQTVGDRNAKAVLRELADCANDETCEMWYSIQTIADTLESSYKTVERGINYLQDKGFIIRTERDKNGGKFTSKMTKILIPEDDWNEILYQRDKRKMRVSPSDNLTDGEDNPSDNLTEGYGEPSDNLTDEGASPSDNLTDGSTAPSDNLTDGSPEHGASPSDNLTNGQNDGQTLIDKDVFSETLKQEEENTEIRLERDPPELNFEVETVLFDDGMKIRLKAPKKIPKRDEWLETFQDYFFENGYNAAYFLEMYELLDIVREAKKLGWHVTPKVMQNNVGKIEQLRQEVKELKNKNGNENGNGNGSRNGKGASGIPGTQGTLSGEQAGGRTKRQFEKPKF